MGVLRLGICVGGVYAAFLLWAIAQEKRQSLYSLTLVCAYVTAPCLLSPSYHHQALVLMVSLNPLPLHQTRATPHPRHFTRRHIPLAPLPQLGASPRILRIVRHLPAVHV